MHRNVGIRDQAHPLLPGPVARGEMGFDVEFRAQMLLHFLEEAPFDEIRKAL